MTDKCMPINRGHVLVPKFGWTIKIGRVRMEIKCCVICVCV
jgi:hypothetical protein